MTAPRDEPSERQRTQSLASLLERRGRDVLHTWVGLQVDGAGGRGSVDDAAALEEQSQEFLTALLDALSASGRVYDPVGPEFGPLRTLIIERSRRGAREGATPEETAHAVLALREAIFTVLDSERESDAVFNDAVVTSARLVDALALLTFQTFVRGREEIITRQTQQLYELSTPVIRLWDGIVGVPLIGTLDSARAQVVMETLLQAIVDEHAKVAILDITGVPTVDTLVAQHLLKTVTATRLMGADCIISGIRPQTAQTIVQLGIDLNEITTRATLADALSTAIGRVAPRTSAAGG